MARLKLRNIVGRRRPLCDVASMEAEAVMYSFMRKPSCEIAENKETPTDQPADRTSWSKPTTTRYESSLSLHPSDSHSISASSSDDDTPAPSFSFPIEPSDTPFIPPAPPHPYYIPGMPRPGLPIPLRVRYSVPAPEEDFAEDTSSVTTRTTHSISICSPSSSELTTRLSRLSRRMPRPTPIHIQSIKIELGDGGEVYDNFEAAVDAIRAAERVSPSQAQVTVVAVGEGVWGSEVGSWVQERPGPAGERESQEGESSVSDEEPPRRSFILRRSSLPSILPAHRPRAPHEIRNHVLRPPTNTKFCMVCVSERNRATMFPLPTSKCDHECNTCKSCMVGWVASNIDHAGISNYVVCPEAGCGESLEFQDVHRLLIENKPDDDTVDAEANNGRRSGKEVWQRYERHSLRAYLGTLDGFVWCLSPSCDSGQIHDPSSGPVMACVACGFKTCAEHQVPWHEGDTCDAFDRKFSRVRNEERIYRVAVKLLRMKDCPTCGITIQKGGGCDHMRCISCRAEFCYRCRHDYEGPDGIWARGKSAHSVQCRHYWARMPWRWFDRF